MERTTSLRRMPDQVRALRDPWPTRVEEVKGLSWEMEQDFRFGQRITRTDQGYVMGGTMKGGTSSMWYPSTREDYHAFKRWQRLEGVQDGRDDEAYARLQALLAPHGVELVTRRSMTGPPRANVFDPEPHPGYGPIYRDMVDVLEALPEEHLSRASLRRLQLGGWGPDAAKASAYHEGAVIMYDFACRGARRTFLGLFLHELGHAHEVALDDPTKDSLHRDYQALVEADAFVGIEFLVDAPTRQLYQKFVFHEFLAETYLIYTSCGQRLLEWIAGYPAPAREAWERVYETFRATFLGCEYE